MKKTLSALMSLILFSVILVGQTASDCDVAAFVLDAESGVNIRAGAGKDFKILKTVPKDKNRTMFEIKGAKADWLKVTYAVNSKNEQVFSGTGWVHAPLLAVTEKRNKYKVFDSPRVSGKRIDIGLFEHFLPLAGCQDEWVKVALPVTGTGVSDLSLTGWMPSGAYCGNPWIECDY